MERIFKTNRVKAVFYLFAFILSSTLYSCLNESEYTNDTEEVTSMTDLIVSEDFTWTTHQDISLYLSAESNNPEFNSKISVYNSNPEKDGELIINCGISDGSSFENEIQIPAHVTMLYLQCTFPSGTVVMDSVSSSDFIEYNFKENSTKSATIITTEAPESPSCSEDCDVTVTATSGNLDIENEQVYCITGNFAGNITFKNGGGTLRICGNTTLYNVNFNGNIKVAIEVTSSGTLTATNLNLNNSEYQLSNWGVLNYSNYFSPNGSFNNYGTTNITGLNINSGATFLNTGQINIAGGFNNNASSENSGTMEVSGSFNNNGSSKFINNCKLIVTGDIGQNSELENSGYIYCGGTFYANGSSVNELISKAMINTKNLMVNSNINGSGDYSSLSISGRTVLNGGSSLTGKLDICDQDGIESNNGTISTSVTYCENYIPTSECNPIGIGEPPIQDSDGDGVPDNQDEYPNDETKAYSTYFPCKNGIATLIFEDLWPSKGDYDYNDLVSSVKGTYTTNKNNKPVKLVLTFNILAVGASQDNGLGIQFDNISSSQILSATGMITNAASGINLNSNGTEANQSKAVIIAIENVDDVLERAGGSMFNTVKNGYIGTSKEVTITISFAGNSVSLNDINPSSFNFFLIKDQERGTEIHLADRKPTDLMTYEFGLSDDTSNPGTDRYYKTKNNLPWGLLILESFKYPIERTAIIDVYSDFPNWAKSNGTSNNNWYNNPDLTSVW